MSISTCLLALSVSSAHANPTSSIVEPIAGCGIGCAIYQTQIGSPYEDRRGIRKVMVRQKFVYTTFAGAWGGKDRVEIENKYFLAECTRAKANFTSYSSNGAGEDDIFKWIDVPYGPEETRSSGPNWETYVQYDRICALRLPKGLVE